MAEPAPGLRTLPHAVFLERLAGASGASSSEARLGRAAFVAMRLVDLLAHDREALHSDAFHYQHVATERACRDLPADRTETTHLIGLVRSAGDAFQADSTSLVLPALFAYAHYLEDEMRLEQALDVLDTMGHIGGDKLSPPDGIALRLRTARVLRKLNQFDAAERWYDEAASLAGESQDRHSQLLSRVGHAYTVTGRGNLGEAERLLRELVREASAQPDTEVQALAHQGIAVVLSAQGQPSEAIPHLWRTFQLYSEETPRTRALADLGGLLLIVGDAVGAERALIEVVRRECSEEATYNALIDLMHCASFRRDRVGFERWRERCEERRDTMPPNILVDFVFKTGVGRARFGQLDRADALLADALRLADAAGLHEFVFRIGRIKMGLADCPDCLEMCGDGQESESTPSLESQAVREVSASLAQLRP